MAAHLVLLVLDRVLCKDIVTQLRQVLFCKCVYFYISFEKYICTCNVGIVLFHMYVHIPTIVSHSTTGGEPICVFVCVNMCSCQ